MYIDKYARIPIVNSEVRNILIYKTPITFKDLNRSIRKNIGEIYSIIFLT